MSHQLPCLFTHTPPCAAATLGSLASLKSHPNESVGSGDPLEGICARRRKHRSTEVEKAEVASPRCRHTLLWLVQSLLGPRCHHGPFSSWASLPWFGASLIMPVPKVAQSMPGFTLFKLTSFDWFCCRLQCTHMCVFVIIVCECSVGSSGGHLIQGDLKRSQPIFLPREGFCGRERGCCPVKGTL